MGGRETTPPPLQRSWRGEGGHPRGGRGGAGRPRPQLRPGDPAAHRGENNFSPAASTSPAPVSGASIAPSDHQREILEEYALQMYMRIIFPRTSRSGGREEKGILAAACVPREAPPSLPAVILLLRSWIQRGSKILPHLFLGNRLTAFY